MEMVMSNGFEELSADEMEFVDGGFNFGKAGCIAAGVWDLGIATCGIVGKVAGVAACTAIASNPVVIGVGVALTVGGLVYTICS